MIIAPYLRPGMSHNKTDRNANCAPYSVITDDGFAGFIVGIC